jgi:hypothetical protein
MSTHEYCTVHDQPLDWCQQGIEGITPHDAKTIISTESLPPTQYLILEVLAARWRLGESSWPFPTRLRPALTALRDLGLVSFEAYNTPGNYRVRLTELGRGASMSDDYVSPLSRQQVADQPYRYDGLLRRLADVERPTGLIEGSGRRGDPRALRAWYS